MVTVVGSAGPVTTHVSTGISRLPAVADEWRRLFAACDAEPSTSFEWTEALVRIHIDSSDKFYLIELRREGALVGVLPIFVRAARVFRLWHRIVRPVAELKNTHSDILLRACNEETMTALLRGLQALDCRWDSLRLSKLIEGAPLTAALEGGADALRLRSCLRYRKAAYWLELPASFQEYLDARSAKFRNYAKRAEKKLRAAGPLQEIEITTRDDFDAGFELLLHVERASWKETHGTSISALPRQAEMYRELGRAMANAGQLHLQLLTLGGEPIAHNFGCIHRGTYYYLKTSYAARYRPLSPATFLRLSLIRNMIERRLTAIDFCGTPYEWERQWTETHRWHHVLSMYANTWRGRVFSALDPWTHRSSARPVIEHGDPRSEQSST